MISLFQYFQYTHFLYDATFNKFGMIQSQGEFLTLIQQFLASLNDLKEILDSYQVESITVLKQKIESKELPEHPTYEDYLDALSLFNSLTEMKSNLIEDVQGIDFESFK